ncbi:MAG: hypothetical protein JNK49_13280 [Planctomycetes bacterium]|nr:hypothetical protein [Planctomycetota bacterium]
MKRRNLLLLAIPTLLSLPACGTANGVRWTYGASSIYGKPDAFSESLAIRAVFGMPVIVGGAAFDVATFPVQLICGVWPMWGDKSQHMKPPAAVQ